MFPREVRRRWLPPAGTGVPSALSIFYFLSRGKKKHGVLQHAQPPAGKIIYSTVLQHFGPRGCWPCNLPCLVVAIFVGFLQCRSPLGLCRRLLACFGCLRFLSPSSSSPIVVLFLSPLALLAADRNIAAQHDASTDASQRHTNYDVIMTLLSFSVGVGSCIVGTTVL